MPPSSEKRAALAWEMGGQFKRQDSWNDHERSRDVPKDYPKLFTLKFRHIAIFTLSIPCFAFFFCIIYSFLFHLDQVTRTHCQVWNVAPSISSSIGILAPQKYVWKICIALHSAPRLLLCKMYHKHMQTVLNKVASVQRLALFTCVLNVAEVFSLLLLSVVPSTEDYFLHTFCFGLFLFFSAMYLAFSYYLFR